jgi:hypothetical protein
LLELTTEISLALDKTQVPPQQKPPESGFAACDVAQAVVIIAETGQEVKRRLLAFHADLDERDQVFEEADYPWDEDGHYDSPVMPNS